MTGMFRETVIATAFPAGTAFAGESSARTEWPQDKAQTKRMEARILLALNRLEKRDCMKRGP
jgi:hypothetical protein